MEHVIFIVSLLLLAGCATPEQDTPTPTAIPAPTPTASPTPATSFDFNESGWHVQGGEPVRARWNETSPEMLGMRFRVTNYADEERISPLYKMVVANGRGASTGYGHYLNGTWVEDKLEHQPGETQIDTIVWPESMPIPTEPFVVRLADQAITFDPPTTTFIITR